MRKGDLLVRLIRVISRVAVDRPRHGWSLRKRRLHRPNRIMPLPRRYPRKPSRQFRSRRDARKVCRPAEQHVVPQEQYDQYTAIAGVDPRSDAARQAAGSALKTIAARQAEVDAARAVLIRPCSTSAIRVSMRPLTGSSASATSS